MDLRPDRPWPEGVLRLHVDTVPEDLAGNSVRRVFDRDLRRGEDDPLPGTEVVLVPPTHDQQEGPATPLSSPS